jgi:hypothetical protein
VTESHGQARARVSGKADRAEGFLRLRDTDTSLIIFREKQLSLAQTILKQEEKKRNFTTRRGCVWASAAAENTRYKMIRSCRLGSRQVEGSSSTLGIDYTFGEVRPSLGRRRGLRISTLKDDIIITPGPSSPGSSPYGAGAGSHASCKLAQSRRSQTAARGACNRPVVTSGPPLLPRPAGERAGNHAGGMQPRQVGAPLRHPTRPSWRHRPTHHATGAPDAACEQLHRHPRHCHASSTAEPVPRLNATLRTTQRRQPGATVNAAKNGPAVMAVAGGQEQRSRRQPSLRPIRGQRENPLSRREDDAPVFCSSNGSRTRNGRPANRTPRRINSVAGKAAPLGGEASDASPSP